jgi:hypothetical protein
MQETLTEDACQALQPFVYTMHALTRRLVSAHVLQWDMSVYNVHCTLKSEAISVKLLEAANCY